MSRHDGFPKEWFMSDEQLQNYKREKLVKDKFLEWEDKIYCTIQMVNN